jgi:hypothetical protein
VQAVSQQDKEQVAQLAESPTSDGFAEFLVLDAGPKTAIIG